MNTLLQEIKLQKEELERIAYYDALTKLYSRSFFEEIIKKHLEILERKKSFSALILIDVDNFKMKTIRTATALATKSWSSRVGA